ncbi:hypothetical protein ABZ357_27715 [Streptomyces sp. NPDC005917]|uniref:hypothetical protein n=1 Tax=unclassified Streptomyces TaxID=2593676 RepID=UPI0034003C27
MVTLDALHAQREHARYLVEERGAHHLLSVKGNQKNLARQLKSLPWKRIPVLHRTAERGHGREEIRELQVVSINRPLFPHAGQVVRMRRRTPGPWPTTRLDCLLAADRRITVVFAVSVPAPQCAGANEPSRDRKSAKQSSPRGRRGRRRCARPPTH